MTKVDIDRLLCEAGDLVERLAECDPRFPPIIARIETARAEALQRDQRIAALEAEHDKHEWLIFERDNAKNLVSEAESIVKGIKAERDQLSRERDEWMGVAQGNSRLSDKVREERDALEAERDAERERANGWTLHSDHWELRARRAIKIARNLKAENAELRATLARVKASALVPGALDDDAPFPLSDNGPVQVNAAFSQEEAR
jgi:DNA repair exonuclease SbcCD ATPase subunit